MKSRKTRRRKKRRTRRKKRVTRRKKRVTIKKGGVNPNYAKPSETSGRIRIILNFKKKGDPILKAGLPDNEIFITEPIEEYSLIPVYGDIDFTISSKASFSELLIEVRNHINLSNAAMVIGFTCFDNLIDDLELGDAGICDHPLMPMYYFNEKAYDDSWSEFSFASMQDDKSWDKYFPKLIRKHKATEKNPLRLTLFLTNKLEYEEYMGGTTYWIRRQAFEGFKKIYNPETGMLIGEDRHIYCKDNPCWKGYDTPEYAVRDGVKVSPEVFEITE